jgi:hypothetical protein
MTVVMIGGEILEARTSLRDQLRYEEASRRGKWGAMSENLLRFETYIAWCALKRGKLVPDDETYEAFADRVEQIDSVVISPRPTQVEALSGSTSS